MPRVVGGRLIIVPQVVSQIDDSALANLNTPGSGTLAVLGESAGGDPTQIYTFSSAAEARVRLRSGKLLDAIERAYAPSAQVPGAYTVKAIRVAGSGYAKSTLSIGAGASTLSSVDVGAWTAQIRVQIQAGTSGFKLTVTTNDGTNTQDNIYRAAIRLTNAHASLAGAITTDATKLRITINSVNYDYTYASYPTVSAIVAAINAQSGTHSHSAVVLGGTDAEASLILDAVTAAATAANGGTLVLTQNADALIDFINSAYASLLSATALSANPGLNSAWVQSSVTYLAGGSDGAAVANNDYQTAFNLLQTTDAQLVCVATDNASIHTMAETHCSTMSDTVNKSERIAIVGGLNSDSVSATLTRALNLNSCRATLVYPGIKAFDNQGNLVTLDPWQVAPMVAGMAAGVMVAEPLTNKTLRTQGIAVQLTRANIEQLISGGVLTLEQRPNRGTVITQSITTWLNDRKYSNRELSVRRAADYVVASVRSALDDLIGGRNGPALLALVVSRTTSVLTELTRQGVLVGDDQNPSFKNITARSDGDTVLLDFTASPALPANYIVLTAHLVAFSGSSSAVGNVQ